VFRFALIYYTNNKTSVKITNGESEIGTLLKLNRNLFENVTTYITWDNRVKTTYGGEGESGTFLSLYYELF